MPFPLSPQSIEALAEVISGGSGMGHTQPIGIYRSAAKLGSFIRGGKVDIPAHTTPAPLPLVAAKSLKKQGIPKRAARPAPLGLFLRQLEHQQQRIARIIGTLPPNLRNS